MTFALDFYAILHIEIVFSTAVNTAADFGKWPRFCVLLVHTQLGLTLSF